MILTAGCNVKKKRQKSTVDWSLNLELHRERKREALVYDHGVVNESERIEGKRRSRMNETDG